MKPPRRVLVTRSAHQSSPLAEALRARGIDPILIPTIEIAPPTSYAALDTALAALPTFHWLVFTSANAVEAFFCRLSALQTTDKVAPRFSVGSHNADENHGALAPASSHIAAIGPATARVLESFGTKPNLIPPQAVAESLAAALTHHALQPDGSPTRFLIPCAEDTRNVLQEQLKLAGADITTVPVYRNVIPTGSIEAIQSGLQYPAKLPDAITFTSGSTAKNLIALLEAAQITLPPQILRISIGPITSQVLADLGFPPHAEADTPSIPSLVEKTVHTLELSK